jgi:hypothetical protein
LKLGPDVGPRLPQVAGTRPPVAARVRPAARRHPRVMNAHRFIRNPALMLLTAARQFLAQVNGFLATVADKTTSRRLSASTAAPEPHDFAVRNRSHSSVVPSRPSHPTARFVTIASRSSCRVGRRRNELIWARTKGEYFSTGHWTNRWRDLPDRATQALVGRLGAWRSHGRAIASARRTRTGRQSLRLSAGSCERQHPCIGCR